MANNAESLMSMQEAVAQVREQHIAAVRSSDAGAAAELFAPDAVMLPPGVPALEGHASILGWFTQVFTAFELPDFDIEPAPFEARGELFLEHGNWRATFQPRDGSPRRPATGTYLTVYERSSGGSIRVIRDTFNGLPG